MYRVIVRSNVHKKFNGQGEFETLEEANNWIEDQKSKYGRKEGEAEYVLSDITDDHNRKLQEKENRKLRYRELKGMVSDIENSNLDSKVKKVLTYLIEFSRF